MATPADLTASALERWRNNLIDLTRRNPLLSLKTGRASYLEITQPDLMKVYDQLQVQGKSWSFFFPPEKTKNDKKSAAAKELPAPRANELLTTETDRLALLQTLTNLYRRALTDYRERGLHILHLALGILEWRDEAEEVFRSPVLLLPVKLERHSLKDPFQLSIAEEDLIVNQALAARLKQEHGFDLPVAPSDWEEKKPDQYLEQLKAAISGLPGWELHPSVSLTLFSFFKGVIFQDLQENAARVQAHPIVQTLAGTPSLLPKVTPFDEKDLDEKQDPQQVFHILDADGSQRLCLEAAARGESFVLIGPPGTGKSQTIANLIADRIAQGKKVLFVSEKMAALEVVYKRLCNVGLGEFCLELHSHKANKREVIKELARCYSETLPAQPQPSAEDFARLKQRREQLNRYVQALHQLRIPMKKSVWAALAELPRWQDLPMIQLGLPAIRQAGDTTTKLTLSEFEPANLDELQQLLQRLQHHWHIRTDKNYPWRGFKADRYSLQLRDEIVSLIDRIRAAGGKLRTSADQYAGQLGLSGSISDLLKLGDLLEKRPANTQASWLTTPDLAAFIADFEKCTEQYQRLGQARKPLTERYGAALWKQPTGTAAKIEQAWKNAVPLLASGDERGVEFVKLQQKLRAWAAETQKRIPNWLIEVRALEKWLALPLPVGAGSASLPSPSGRGAGGEGTANEMKLDPSVEALRAFVRLANLGIGEAPPDRTWLEDRNVAKDAQAIITSSKAAFLRYKQNRLCLLKIYEEKLFKLDLTRIGQAYAGPYQSWWCVFRWKYRKDRRAIAKCRPMEDIPATVVDDMRRGAEVQADKATLEADQPQRSKLLARYEKGLDTDIETAEKAARHAMEAHGLLQHIDCERFPPKCIEALIAGSPPEKVRAAFKRLHESFVAWSHLTHELHAILPMTRLPNVGEPLDECALSALMQYTKDVQSSLNQFAALADPVLGATLPADIQAFVADLKQAEELLAFEASQATEAERWTKLIGPAFQGVGTDWETLRKAITWTRRVRECVPSPPTPLPGGEGRNLPVVNDALLKAATTTPPSSRELRQTLEQYQHALHSLELRYDAPGPQLDGKALREHAPETVLDLLTKGRDRVGELSDWVDWRYLPERFQHLGLKSFWDHLQQHDVVREQVVDLFLKSYWSGWVDAMFQHDPVLAQYRRNEHEILMKEFRELDRRILQQGAARIIAILDPLQSNPLTPRPTTPTGGGGQALTPPPSPARGEGSQEKPLTPSPSPARGEGGQAGDAGQDAELALLMKEAHKKTKHLPLRQLFDTMPALLLRLKPCMLMSPLSVSQFLPADAAKVQFDLIVFDEASQILPEDAVGAIYRGKQLVITGDNQQLPPTTFFQQNADDGAEEEETPLFESIFDGCLGAGIPSKMLRWHYRSQHEHLIAFSNETYYEGRLVTFPSACFQHPTLGVQLKFVEKGVYDRGGKRDNPREAQAVAELVLEHYRVTPDKTLGVIAFSYAQMDAIEDEIERQLRDKPDLERFFKGDRLEGFFVKNLETVQGDERDVIVLSVGYGRDDQGKIELNFGPLNREGGERRLNVAVTRARQRLIVVSSIRAREINLGNSQAKGLAHLQKYLDFAEHGMNALSPEATPLPLTGLHEDVMRELKKLGFDSNAFVGCGPCRLDIGVCDPKKPGQFVLGIEFDGPMHAQAATARDRDRLRPEVLTRLGWKLHRIGSPDWIFRKEEEIARLRQALGLSVATG
jgi:hypothetical protein